MGNDKNRKNFFKKHLTNEKSGCIMRHIERQRRLWILYLEVPLSHFNKEKGKGVFRDFSRKALYLFHKKEF